MRATWEAKKKKRGSAGKCERREKRSAVCACGGVTASSATRKSKNSNWERVKEEDSTSVVLGPGNSFIQNAELKKQNKTQTDS